MRDWESFTDLELFAAVDALTVTADRIHKTVPGDPGKARALNTIWHVQDELLDAVTDRADTRLTEARGYLTRYNNGTTNHTDGSE